MSLTEMSFAYERAGGVIESSCVKAETAEGFENGWYDLDQSDVDLDDEVAYLESRSLLEHHPDNPRWVIIRDEGDPVGEQTGSSDQVKPASGELIVALTADGQNVVINHPDLQPDAEGCGHIVFSPDQALRLAGLLLKKANIARGWVCGHCNDLITQEGGWATALVRYCFKEECQQEFYKEAQAMIRKVDPETAELLAAATKLNGPTTCDHAEGKAWVSHRDGIEVCTLCCLSRKEKRFTCPKCGAVSHNPNDVAQRYCGACHSFFGELEIGLRR